MINCLSCSSLTSNLMFCSRSCAASHPNHGRPALHRPCLWCGAGCRGVKTRKVAYCSVRCSRSFRHYAFILAWLSGVLPGGSGNDVSEHVVSYLLEHQSGACLDCGLSEWQGASIALQVEHLDGDYRNNGRANLCLICPNCHAQKKTSGSKNAGRGRPERLMHAMKTLIVIKKANTVLNA